MVGSSLSLREVTDRLAVVTASELQSPASSTPYEINRLLLNKNRWKMEMTLVRHAMAKKNSSTLSHNDLCQQNKIKN